MATKNYASKSQLIAIMGDAATKTAEALADKVDKIVGEYGDRASIYYTNTANANYGVEIKAEKDISTQEAGTVHTESRLDIDDNSAGIMNVQSGSNGHALAQIRVENGKAYYQNTTNSSFPARTSSDEIVNKGFLAGNNYTKSEVDGLISTAKTGRFIAVSTLPDVAVADTTAIYLVPKASPESQNIKDEYIVVVTHDDLTDTDVKSWEKIGETTIDLSDYATETWVNEQIAAIDVPADLSSSDVDDIKAAFSLS